MWGLFELDDSIHIIPIDQAGIIRHPHKLYDFCFCNPTAPELGEDGRLLIVHNEVN